MSRSNARWILGLGIIALISAGVYDWFRWQGVEGVESSEAAQFDSPENRAQRDAVRQRIAAMRNLKTQRLDELRAIRGVVAEAAETQKKAAELRSRVAEKMHAPEDWERLSAADQEVLSRADALEEEAVEEMANVVRERTNESTRSKEPLSGGK